MHFIYRRMWQRSCRWLMARVQTKWNADGRDSGGSTFLLTFPRSIYLPARRIRARKRHKETSPARDQKCRDRVTSIRGTSNYAEEIWSPRGGKTAGNEQHSDWYTTVPTVETCAAIVSSLSRHSSYVLFTAASPRETR